MAPTTSRNDGAAGDGAKLTSKSTNSVIHFLQNLYYCLNQGVLIRLEFKNFIVSYCLPLVMDCLLLSLLYVKNLLHWHVHFMHFFKFNKRSISYSLMHFKIIILVHTQEIT